MEGNALVTLLRTWHERLRAHPRYFDPVLELAPTVPEATLAATEARLGCELPKWLRRFYGECAGRVAFAFDVNDTNWEGDGYVDTMGAQLDLHPPDMLAPHRLDDSLVDFTSDGLGNGWCFCRDDSVLVWIDHDSDEPGEIVDSFEQLLDDPLGRLVTLGRVDDAIDQLLRTGELPAP